jgi:hypothetical protein
MTSKALNHLRQTHAAGSQLLQRFNHTPESVEIAIEVEKHREHWKPKQPKLILVAESHVSTTKPEMEFQLDETKIRPFIKSEATLPPNHFVRFVYCLAYGESELNFPKAAHDKNTAALLREFAHKWPDPDYSPASAPAS